MEHETAMNKPSSMRELEELGRVRLSEHFFMREMLYSEIANFHGLSNIPDDPDLAITAGTALCERLLEPLYRTFGHVSIRSAFRSEEVNEYGAVRIAQGYGCGPTQWNFSRHIWDRRDEAGYLGATACIVLPWFVTRYKQGTPWQALAWWIHDNLPYSHLAFYPNYAAFNIQWHETPVRRIDSYKLEPEGCLTAPGMRKHSGDHRHEYPDFPKIC